MAVSFVGSSDFAIGRWNISVGACSGVQAGDLILLLCESANEPITTPAGYARHPGSPVVYGTAAEIGAIRLDVFYAIATGNDATTTVNDSGDHTTGRKYAYRGVDPATPFDVSVSAAGVAATAPPGNVTASRDGSIIVYCCAFDYDGNASSAWQGPISTANGHSGSVRGANTALAGSGGGVGLFDVDIPTAGSIGSYLTTGSSSITGNVNYLAFALLPKQLATHTTEGQSCVQSGTASSGAVQVQHVQTVAASNVVQGCAYDSAAVGQMHVLGGLWMAQVVSGTSAPVQQEHRLAGAPLSQSSESSPGQVKTVVEQMLSATACLEVSESSSGAIVHAHALSVATVTQDSVSSSGTASQTHAVLGWDATSSMSLSVGAVGQTHALTSQAVLQQSMTTAGGMDRVLSAASLSVTAVLTDGRMSQDHVLVGQACHQTSVYSEGRAQQEHALSAASNVYESVAQSGGIDQLHHLSGEPVYQSALSRRIVEYIEPKCTSWLIRPDTHTVNIVMDAMTAVSQQPMMTANMLDGYSIYQKLDTFSVEIRQCYKS